MSKINIKKMSAVLAVFLLAGLMLAGAGAAEDTASIGIQVVDSADNQTPIEGAGIVVAGNGITTPITGVTNSSGFWSYDGLSTSVEYVVTVRKDGYYDSTTIIYGGQNNVVSLTRSLQEVVNAFYYVQGYNMGTNPVLAPGNVYIDLNGNSFAVPTLSEWYLKPEDAPAGTYFHMIGTGSSEYDQIVYVDAPKLSYSNISNSTIYTDDGQTPKTTQITVEVANDMYPYLIFEKADAEGVFVDGNNIVTVDARNKFTVTANVNYKGTWNVYADFSKTVNEDLSVSDNANLYKKTPVEYKYVMIGSFKIAQNKDPIEASMTVSTNEICDGNIFSASVKSSYDREDPNYVTVKYFEEGETEDDAVKVTLDQTKDFYYVEGQSSYDETEEAFIIPATKEVTLGIYTNSKNLKDKTYHFLVYASRCGDNEKGGLNNPLAFDMRVKSNDFTVSLGKSTYAKGEAVDVNGTYSSATADFGVYIYVEGPYVPFFAPSYAIKTDESGTIVANKSVEYGSYTYVFDAVNFNDLNSGPYTVYVSKEKCSEITPMKGDYSFTQQYTIGNKTKIETIENAKILTLIIREPMIRITSVDTNVKSGIEDNKGQYLTAHVLAEGTDTISLYIIGDDNKVYYINGGDIIDSSKKSPFIKNLDESDSERYLFSDASTNLYKYNYTDSTGISHKSSVERSVEKVAEKLGLNLQTLDPTKNQVMPLFLILDNQNGTYTIYLHMQKSSEITEANRGTFYSGTGYSLTGEQYNNTAFGEGKKYLIVQHHMADQIFNTWVKYEDSKFNVYVNGELQYNLLDYSGQTAAEKLIASIEYSNDQCANTTFTVIPGSEPEPGYLTTLHLRSGWNFISVPMTLDSSMDTAGEFFEEVDMDNHSVLGYDSSTKSWKQLTASTVLKPLDAYWVYSKEDFVGTKTIVFDTQSPSVGNTKEIYKGWNAVGLNIDVTDGTYFLSSKSTFAGLDWNRYFEKYTTGAWKTIVNGGSSSESEEKYIYAGAGGWIYANEDGILIGNAS